MTALGQFVAGAAHEINNKLQVILMSSQQLLQTIRGKEYSRLKPEEIDSIEKTAKIIIKHSKRCGDITRSLLQFSRKEKPKKVPGT